MVNSPFPPTIAQVPANAAHSGYMQRWHAGDATHGPFAVTATGMQGLLYVPLATSTLAGAFSAANFNALASLRVPGLRLNVAAGTDIASGLALTAGTYADIFPNQNFTATATGVYLVMIRFSCAIGAVAGAGGGGARAIINSAGTPINVKFGGASWPAAGQGVVGSGGTFSLGPGLPAGTNTIKLQAVSSVNAQAFCRASTVPNTEFAEIQILEMNV